MSQPTEIPALGKIAGLARKEGIYDTEGNAAATAIASQIQTFQNFVSFATAGLGLTKAFGRDTNLTGGQGGLPQAHRFMWYRWRAKSRTLNASMQTVANWVMFEQIRRYGQLAFKTFQLAQTRYITVQKDDLVSYASAEYVNIVDAAATHLVITPACGDRQGKDVTVRGEPKILEPLENFTIITGVPGGSFSPTTDIYETDNLDGVLIRGIVG